MKIREITICFYKPLNCDVLIAYTLRVQREHLEWDLMMDVDGVSGQGKFILIF